LLFQPVHWLLGVLPRRIYVDAILLAEVEELHTREVRSQVCDDAIWYLEPEYYLLDEFYYFG
jgi:hypothetical protein